MAGTLDIPGTVQLSEIAVDGNYALVGVANGEDRDSATVRTDYAALLQTMIEQQAAARSLAPAVAHFRKVTASYAPGLFHCYDVPDLPPTNNALEQCFSSRPDAKRPVRAGSARSSK